MPISSSKETTFTLKCTREAKRKYMIHKCICQYNAYKSVVKSTSKSYKTKKCTEVDEKDFQQLKCLPLSYIQYNFSFISYDAVNIYSQLSMFQRYCIEKNISLNFI